MDQEIQQVEDQRDGVRNEQTNSRPSHRTASHHPVPAYSAPAGSADNLPAGMAPAEEEEELSSSPQRHNAAERTRQLALLRRVIANLWRDPDITDTERRLICQALSELDDADNTLAELRNAAVGTPIFSYDYDCVDCTVLVNDETKHVVKSLLGRLDISLCHKGNNMQQGCKDRWAIISESPQLMVPQNKKEALCAALASSSWSSVLPNDKPHIVLACGMTRSVDSFIGALIEADIDALRIYSYGQKSEVSGLIPIIRAAHPDYPFMFQLGGRRSTTFAENSSGGPTLVRLYERPVGEDGKFVSSAHEVLKDESKLPNLFMHSVSGIEDEYDQDYQRTSEENKNLGKAIGNQFPRLATTSKHGGFTVHLSRFQKSGTKGTFVTDCDGNVAKGMISASLYTMVKHAIMSALRNVKMQTYVAVGSTLESMRNHLLRLQNLMSLLHNPSEKRSSYRDLANGCRFEATFQNVDPIVAIMSLYKVELQLSPLIHEVVLPWDVHLDRFRLVKDSFDNLGFFHGMNKAVVGDSLNRRIQVLSALALLPNDQSNCTTPSFEVGGENVKKKENKVVFGFVEHHGVHHRDKSTAVCEIFPTDGLQVDERIRDISPPEVDKETGELSTTDDDDEGDELDELSPNKQNRDVQPLNLMNTTNSDNFLGSIYRDYPSARNRLANSRDQVTNPLYIAEPPLPPFQGVVNMGNDCYCISFCQILINTPAIERAFATPEFHRCQLLNRDDRCVFYNLNCLRTFIHNSMERAKTMASMHIERLIRRFFGGSKDQQEAHELMVKIFTLMNDNRDDEEKDCILALKRLFSCFSVDKYSINICCTNDEEYCHDGVPSGGQLRNMSCIQLTFSGNPSHDRTVLLQSLIDLEENQVFPDTYIVPQDCPHCKGAGSHRLLHKFEIKSENLILALNRTWGGEGGLRAKYTDKLSSYMNVHFASSSFKLTGVAVHVGSDMNSGHWLTYSLIESRSHWYKANDDKPVVEVEEEELTSDSVQRGATIFIYKRNESVNETDSSPTLSLSPLAVNDATNHSSPIDADQRGSRDVVRFSALNLVPNEIAEESVLGITISSDDEDPGFGGGDVACSDDGDDVEHSRATEETREDSSVFSVLELKQAIEEIDEDTDEDAFVTPKPVRRKRNPNRRSKTKLLKRKKGGRTSE